MTDYRLIQEQADEIIAAEPFYVASLANLSALLFESMEGLNWAGFYLMDKGSLLGGPDPESGGRARFPGTYRL